MAQLLQSFGVRLKLLRRRAYIFLRRVYFLSRDWIKNVGSFRIKVEIDRFPEYFDRDYYLESNIDVSISGMDPLVHFNEFGRFEGRKYRVFDNDWYERVHPDVKLSRKNGYEHYMEYGKREGRRARYLVTFAEYNVEARLDYSKWLDQFGHLAQASTPLLEALAVRPRISVVMAVYNTPQTLLEEAIESVLGQTYEDWELCIADDASTAEHVAIILERFASSDPRIRFIRREKNGHISAATNDALGLATGDFVAFLDHDDLLAPGALSAIAVELNTSPDADIIYSDEDKIDQDGRRYDPYFKPDYNYELLLAQNYFNHLTVIRRSLVVQVGGLREGYEGAQDHDLLFRVIERTTPDRIAHVPQVLYHWRAVSGSTALAITEKSYASNAGIAAVQQHLDRRGVKGRVESASANCGHYRVRYALGGELPKVSIIIPTRDRADILSVCLESLLSISTYVNFEIIIADNGSREAATFELFNSQPKDRVRVIRLDQPFNFSAINNAAVREATGEFVCLMNNDIEVVTPDWLNEMMSFAVQPGVGCVGARLWYPDNTLQHGGIILGIGGVAGHAHKYLDRKAPGYFCRASHHQSFSAVTAACLVVRKSTYDSVGGLDESLAVAFNDVDFCLRVRETGLRNVWTPYAEMIHHESASRGLELTPDQQKRFKAEVDAMLDRWREALVTDPAYNPNLSLEFEDFSFAWPPRAVQREAAGETRPVGEPVRRRSGSAVAPPGVRARDAI